MGLFVTAYTLLEALWKGKKAPRNPWGSAGYEWMTETPPCLWRTSTRRPSSPAGRTTTTSRRPRSSPPGWDEMEDKPATKTSGGKAAPATKKKD